MAIKREFRGFGVERLPVVKLDAGTQFDGHFLAVGGGFVRQRELRHDVELFVNVEQLVAQRGEYDTADISPPDRRIQNIRILGQPNAQRGLGGSRCGQRCAQRRR